MLNPAPPKVERPSETLPAALCKHTGAVFALESFGHVAHQIAEIAPPVQQIYHHLLRGLAGRIGPRLPLSVGPLLVAVGFLLLLRLDARADYWTDVFPGILVIAIGMSGAVAPLTTAVLSSVDSRHTGSASGLNSAVARTAGMVATALLGGVLGARGASLIAGFDTAAIVCAIASLGASASAFFLIRIGGMKE